MTAPLRGGLGADGLADDHASRRRRRGRSVTIACPCREPFRRISDNFQDLRAAPCFCRRACFLQCYFLRHSASQDVQSFASAAARRPQEHAPQINPQSDWNRVEAATLLERALGRHPPSTHGSARMRACPSLRACGFGHLFDMRRCPNSLIAVGRVPDAAAAGRAPSPGPGRGCR